MISRQVPWPIDCHKQSPWVGEPTISLLMQEDICANQLVNDSPDDQVLCGAAPDRYRPGPLVYRAGKLCQRFRSERYRDIEWCECRIASAQEPRRPIWRIWVSKGDAPLNEATFLSDQRSGVNRSAYSYGHGSVRRVHLELSQSLRHRSSEPIQSVQVLASLRRNRSASTVSAAALRCYPSSNGTMPDRTCSIAFTTADTERPRADAIRWN